MKIQTEHRVISISYLTDGALQHQLGLEVFAYQSGVVAGELTECPDAVSCQKLHNVLFGDELFALSQKFPPNSCSQLSVDAVGVHTQIEQGEKSDRLGRYRLANKNQTHEEQNTKSDRHTYLPGFMLFIAQRVEWHHFAFLGMVDSILSSSLTVISKASMGSSPNNLSERA